MRPIDLIFKVGITLWLVGLLGMAVTVAISDAPLPSQALAIFPYPVFAVGAGAVCLITWVLTLVWKA